MPRHEIALAQAYTSSISHSGALWANDEVNAMNANSFGIDLADEQILNDELPDETLERAGGLEYSWAGLTIAMCSGLSPSLCAASLVCNG